MNRFLLLSLIFFNPFVFFGQLNTSNLSNEMPHVVKTESIEYFEVKKRFGKIYLKFGDGISLITFLL